jgi:hypothetical protein
MSKTIPTKRMILRFGAAIPMVLLVMAADALAVPSA